MRGNKVIGIVIGAVVLTTVCYFLAEYFSKQPVPGKDAAIAEDTGVSNAAPDLIVTDQPVQRVSVNIVEDEECLVPENLLTQFTMPVTSTDKFWYK